jgi:hypothetical protein
MKKFCDMNQTEMTEVNVLGKMPDGTPIDEKTAKANLHRLLPMVKDTLARNLDVLTDLTEAKMQSDPIYREWKQDCDKLKKLIDDAERKIGK